MKGVFTGFCFRKIRWMMGPPESWILFPGFGLNMLYLKIQLIPWKNDFFFCIFEVKIQLLERRDDKRFHIWYVTWTYFDRKYNSAKFTHLWLDFWVDFFVFHVYALKNIKIYPFLCIKIKNQNSCGIVSMQKLIIATVVISRLNMFQKCPILESLGLFSFHGGSQKISKIDSKIFKNALKTFYT